MKRSTLDRFIFLRQGIWTFKKRVPGRGIIQKSLNTPDRELARAKRDAILTQLTADELAEIRGPRSRTATLGEVFKTYAAGIHSVTQIEPDSVTKAQQDCRRFMRWAKAQPNLTEEQVDALPFTEFLALDTLRAFKTNYLAVAGADREALERRRRGASSLLRNATAILSRAAQPLYKSLKLPKLEEFLQAAEVDHEDRRHVTIAPAQLRGMAEAIEADEISNDLWLVHALHKFAGLRNDEIEQARVEWFTRAPWGQVFLGVTRRPYFEPKQSEGFVPVCAEVAALFAPLLRGRQPLDFLVLPQGTVAQRSLLVNREHAAFIRRFLPAATFAKAGYELRRWAAQVFELKHGKDASENFLRHKRQGVAAAHYLDEWARWRRLGADLGVTLAEARGESTIEVLGTWATGAEALANLMATPANDSQQTPAHEHP